MPITVNTIQNLKDLDPAGVASDHVVVLGYHTEGDEGGGIFWWVPSSSEVANDGTIIASEFDPPAGQWKRVFSGPVDVHWFGAVGKDPADTSTGPPTNDTLAIQAALDAYSHVVLRRGWTYTLEPSEEYAFGRNQDHPVCLVLNSFQVLDGRGGTLRLADNYDAIVLMNHTATAVLAKGETAATTTGIRIRNLVIDGNGTWGRTEKHTRPTIYFTTPSPAEEASGADSNEGDCVPVDCDARRLAASAVEDLEIENVQIQNSYVFALYAEMKRFVLRNIRVTNAQGDGFHLFGSDGFMDELHVDTTSELPDLAEGACHVYDLQEVQIGRLTAVNCWWAYKFQGCTRNLSIGSILFRGVGGATPHVRKAVKFQGTVCNPIRNINVGRIEVCDAATTGLYLHYVENLNIGQYIGSNNGYAEGSTPVNKDGSDILVTQGVTGLRMGQVVIENPAFVALYVDGGVEGGQDDLEFGQVSITSPGTCAMVVDRTAARIRFDSLALHGNNAPGNDAYIGIQGGCHFQVGQYSTDVPIEAGKLAVSLKANDASVVQIDRVKFGTDAPHGSVVLTGGAMSTTIVNSNVLDFVGNGGAVRPTVEVRPVNREAAFLGAMQVVPNDSSADGGFSIRHATAGSNAVVFWRVTGYANFPDAWSNDLAGDPRLSATARWNNPPLLAVEATAHKTIAVSGALPGDRVTAAYAPDLPDGVLLWATARANAVRLHLVNLTAAEVRPPPGDVLVDIWRR